MRIQGLAAAVLGAAVLAAGAAHAVTGVLITASGTWGSNAPTTAISAPDETWSLSFLEPNPLDSDPGTIVGQGWATNFAQDLTYTLGGVANSSVFSQAEFFDPGFGGGIDVNFNSSADTLSIYSDSDTAYADESSGAFLPLPFTESITESYGDGAVEGTGTISITSQSFTPTNPNTPPIPEPSSWALMLLGAGLVGAALRRRSSVAAA